MSANVLLTNPKFQHNVGGAFRACAAFGAETLVWTGKRVDLDEILERDGRLPREERMRGYLEQVAYEHRPDDVRPLNAFPGAVPVCVEVKEDAENIVDFVHPENAVYVFGPEDGSVAKGIQHACHRFLYIPTHFCLNLVNAVNVVLYDRRQKEYIANPEVRKPLAELLV